MKSLPFLCLFTLAIAGIFGPARAVVNKPLASPLTAFSAVWNDPKYEGANTAATVTYMSASEKEVIHILNLFRMDPALFNNTVVSKYPAYSGKTALKGSSYYRSLVSALQNMQPLNILQPNQTCFESAWCHAQTSGNAGYVGHERLTAACKKSTYFFGECISYGYNTPLDIVMSLLIDENVPSLGHRKIFLGDYKTVAVSVQPHNTYRYNAVIDFAY
jgi:uncharacterized protein YkwD